MAGHIDLPFFLYAEHPATFLHHYPTYKSKQPHVSEPEGLSDISRTTVYKYIGLLEA